MTDIEHMVAWIESSQPHYNRLCKMETYRKGAFINYTYLATEALSIVASAYREATHGGDMFAEQWSAAQLLDAAKALLSWELEQ